MSDDLDAVLFALARALERDGLAPSGIRWAALPPAKGAA